MRSGTNCTITSGEVFAEVQECLLRAKLVKDHGWLCTAAVVLGIVLRAAGRSISVTAACRDMAHAPSDQAILTALEEGLPKTLAVLERRLNECLTGPLPSRMRRRAWPVAIDWHLQPYYGQPYKSRNEIYYSKPKQGTKKFHAYASACIVEYGRRYTLALTWVRRRETMVKVLRRLLEQIRKIGLKIRYVLLDRAFFNVPVMQFLQEENLPFLMPVMFRGRPSKKQRKATGLRDSTEVGGLVQVHDEEPQARGDFSDLRWIPDQSQRRQTGTEEVVVRRLASERHTHGDSRTLPPAFRHRNELSPDASGKDLHLHTQSASAAVLSGRGADPSKYLGMASSNTLCRRPSRQPYDPPGTAALQTHARMDRL